MRLFSGDIDIPVIMLASTNNNNIFIVNGSGKHRKLLSINSSILTEIQKQALLGLHSFSGCDQNSSMLRKSKMKCWKAAQEHLETFSNLGNTYEVLEQLAKQVERYVCALYGINAATVQKITIASHQTKQLSFADMATSVLI